MSDYAKKMLDFAKSNQVQLTKAANQRQKSGESEVTGYFLYYQDYDSGKGKMFTTENVPNGKEGTTKTGGMWYMKNAFIILSDVMPTEGVKRNEDGTFTITTSVTVDAKTSQNVMDCLRERRIEKYYDFENDKIRTSIDIQIAPNMVYPVTISAYSKPDMANLYEIDPVTQKPKIRKTKRVNLEGAKFGIRLRTYQRTVQGTDDKVTVLLDEWGITTKKMVLDETHQDSDGTMSGLFDRIFPKDKQFLHDIKDVLDPEQPDVKIPSNCHIYTSATGLFEHESGKLIRQMISDGSRGNFVYGADSDKIETRIQARYSCCEIYPDKQQNFIVNFTAYQDTCSGTGLDTGDFDLWADLLTSHYLSSHFICQYSEQKTLSAIQNQPAVVADRERQENFSHGTYDFTVKQWAVDWEDTLKKRGIRITKDVFLKTFKEANAGLSSMEKKFKVATVDGKDELVFISVLPDPNQLLIDGVKSKVINFGSGNRPVINCADATEIVEAAGAQFYALTGVPTENSEEWTTPEEGSAVFEKQLNERNVKYQLFVIQNPGEIKK